MKRQIKLKIIGGSPRSFLLAFILAKLNCDVYMYDFLRGSNFKRNDQIFFLSNYSKNLLNKFDIWNEIEKISYGINSLSIHDDLVSEKLLLRSKNNFKTFLNNIGWTVNYSDFKNVFINKLNNLGNFHFLLEDQLSDKSLNFDYEFNFKNYDKVLNFFKLPLSSFRKEGQILSFNVYLRGHVEKRLYEINTTKGFLVLTPLSNNLYQIIWNNPPSTINERSLNSKSFFLDNLTTLLPQEFKIDQIIGDINSLHFDNISSVFFIKNKSIYFNENKFKSNTLYDFIFDFFFRYIYQIHCLIKNKNINKKFFIFNKSYFLLKNFMILKITIYIYCCFINLLSLNNKFLLIFRKLLFNFFNRINFLKIFIIRILINSNIYNLIK